jgi:MFS transporter, ACS family, aldohexuronate transporter
MTQTVAIATKAVAKIRGLRWYICALLFFVTFINYVDRVSLGAMAPMLKEAIGWDDAQFGWINFAFQLSYAAMFPFAGRLLDRVGVRNGLAIGVLVWSLAAAAHSFATTVLGFALARFLLGLGEATNFPACIKAVAEWFPKRQRSLATGIFNTGTNFGAMLQGAMMWLAVSWGWQAAFIAIGLLGFVWLTVWMRAYRSPEEHPRLSTEEAELIRSDQEPPAKALNVPWQSLLRYREAWAFCIGKMLTDPVWWFYLTWLPSYLQRERDVTLASAAGALLVIYLAADLGSVFGGWLPAFFIRRGWSGTRARLATMALFAAGLPVSALGVVAKDLWTAVAFISIATACHQAWSANMFTVASDAFPSRAVGSVVGFGRHVRRHRRHAHAARCGRNVAVARQLHAALHLRRRHAPPRLDRDSRAGGKEHHADRPRQGPPDSAKPRAFRDGAGAHGRGRRARRARFCELELHPVGDEKLRRRCRRWRCRRELARPDGPCAGLREPRSSARCRPFGGVIARAGTRRVCEGPYKGTEFFEVDHFSNCVVI